MADGNAKMADGGTLAADRLGGQPALRKADPNSLQPRSASDELMRRLKGTQLSLVLVSAGDADVGDELGMTKR